MTPRVDSSDLTRWKWELDVVLSIFQMTIKFSSEACMLRTTATLAAAGLMGLEADAA